MNLQNIRSPYWSDLTDVQWQRLAPFIPQCESNKLTGGRPEKYRKREIVNAILYLKTTSCQWKQLPHDFPPWPIVYYYFNVWSKNEVWRMINKKLAIMIRRNHRKKSMPSVAIIDSQTAKTSHYTRETGYDAGKKTVGRKRHILTDTLGLLIEVVVHPADIQDRDGAKLLLKKARTVVLQLKKIFADGGYTGKLIAWVKRYYRTLLEIVKRSDLHKFVVLPKRWIVERTLSWLSKARRLAREYEVSMRNEESMIYVTMIHVMLKRL